MWCSLKLLVLLLEVYILVYHNNVVMSEFVQVRLDFILMGCWRSFSFRMKWWKDGEVTLRAVLEMKIVCLCRRVVRRRGWKHRQYHMTKSHQSFTQIHAEHAEYYQNALTGTCHIHFCCYINPCQVKMSRAYRRYHHNLYRDSMLYNFIAQPYIKWSH